MKVNASAVATVRCHAVRAAAFVVTLGAGAGEALGRREDLCLGDVYALEPRAATFDALVVPGAATAVDAARACAAGTPTPLYTPEARLVFMAGDGALVDVILLRPALSSAPAERAFVPVSPVEPGVGYTLIAVTADTESLPLATGAPAGFLRGTRITLADGRQRQAELLHPGDLVLTRDNGPQPLRLVLRRTLRRAGDLAPVVIPQGVLSNAGDLVVSQDQRLFLYQRGPRRLSDSAATLVRARDLVDGQSVTLQRGGHADYVSLVFDRHEVIYAECIPAESLLVNEATRPLMPEDDRAALAEKLPGLSQAPVPAAEAASGALKAAHGWLLRQPGPG